MSLRELLFGRALRSEEQEAQRIGAVTGVAVLGLDALASASYGPEAALTVLLAAGAAGNRLILPIIGAILLVLFLLFLSYYQTIAAYPSGGGSYTVASENLGETAGLFAASALSLDYILNVAVAISAGVGAIVSSAPALLPYTLPLCLLLLALITIVNLRGVREAGLVFSVPTYLFACTLAFTILVGIGRALAAHGAPAPRVQLPLAPTATHALTAWIILRAFASGCTAMTGVEAVSNAVPLFKEPGVTRARRTLTTIVLLLAALLTGIAILTHVFHIAATIPGRRGYESVLSQITGAVLGHGVLYYITMASVFAVLALSANTSFSGFPRLCRTLALDEYLPAEFAHLGRRLVYSSGITFLGVAAGLLLLIFHGITDRLIPLFAVGAFVAFTLSQIGMVVHWKRHPAHGSGRAMFLNATGAAATTLTLLVIAVSKFTEGAWISILLVPGFVVLYRRIRRLNDRVEELTEEDGPIVIGSPPPPPPIVVVPTRHLDLVERKALRFALTISDDVHAVTIRSSGRNHERIARSWEKLVEEPARAAGLAPPKWVEIPTEYREFFGPLIAYVKQLARENPKRQIAVVVPELVQRRWYHYFIKSHRATLLKHLLIMRGGPQIIVINTPWYLRG